MEGSKMSRNSTYDMIRGSSIIFRWTIAYYNSSLGTHTKSIKSQMFGSKSDEKRKWFMEFVPKRMEKGSQKELHFKLHRTDEAEVCIRANIFLESKANNSVSVSGDFRGTLAKHEKFVCFQENIGCLAKKLDWNAKERDVLTVVADLNIYFLNEFEQKVDFDSRNLVMDISKSYDDPTFKDVTFLVKNKRFTAHQNILAARSEVFAEMFKNQRGKELPSKVEVNDIEPEIFEKMLLYVYSDKVENLESIAPKLFVLAHKCDLKKLQDFCVKSMCKNLTINNVIKVLVLADTYLLPELRKSALTFLAAHAKMLRNNAEFILAIKSHPHFALDLLTLKDND